jgi:hypothetical protein
MTAKSASFCQFPGLFGAASASPPCFRYICGGQSVGKGRRRLGIVFILDAASCCLLSLASAECFPRLEWQSSGRPVVRLSSFLQAVHGYPSRKEACRTLAYAATSLTVLKSPASQGGSGWRMEKARMPGSPSPTVLDIVG